MRPPIADPRSDMSQDERDAPAAAGGPRGAAPGTCHAEPAVCGMRCPRPRKILAALTRGHWGIESVHWIRDTACAEDANTS